MSDRSVEEDIARLRIQMAKAKEGEIDFTTDRLCQTIESDLKRIINSAMINLFDHADLIEKIKELKK